MVLDVSLCDPGQTKRNSPLESQQDCSGCSAPSAPALAHQRFPYYALIYMDDIGHVQVEESPSIQQWNQSFFTPELRERFRKLAGGKEDYSTSIFGTGELTQHIVGPNGDVSFPNRSLSFQHSIKFRERDGLSVDVQPWQKIRQVKRKRSSQGSSSNEIPFTDQIQASQTKEFALPATHYIALEIGDEEKVKAYYETAFKNLQQLNCRQMAKAFIKFIEPRKQVKHPYNGGKPLPGAPPGQKGDPEKTKPEWWPPGVVHKEPDHLKKDQRLRLLVHIVRNLGKHGITSDKLKEVAYDIKRQIDHPDGMEIMEEIFRVRKLEEKFEGQEVDRSALVYVVNRQPNVKNDKDSDIFSGSDHQLDPDDVEDVAGGLLTPLSSARPASAPLASAIDPLTVAQAHQDIMPAGITGDRNQAFQLAAPVKYDPQQRQPHTFQSSDQDVKVEYRDDFSSHGMARTSTNSTTFSTSVHPGFDYITQASFSHSIPEAQVRPQDQRVMQAQQSPPFSADWPDFHFNTVSYTADSNRSMQPPLPYHHYQHLPVTETSDIPPLQVHTAHSLPELHHTARSLSQLEAMTTNQPPFRTGSLSHPHVLPQITTNGNESPMI